ncbi:MAG: malto-oligosyltrehalose trehalohydrolase [Alphaproteobacteria bacterium]
MSGRGYRFGPAVEGDGVRFRLWAPALAEVRVAVNPGGAGERVHTLARQDDGWHEGLVPEARPGTRYLFDVDGLRVPDPASRFQPDDALGPSEVVDTDAFAARPRGWRGRPWAETVLYELHVGTFSPSGDYAGVTAKLDHLAETGVTAIELMPLADFPGGHNWGYDGVLPFAPDGAYGRPEDLVALIDAAHAKGLMVFLDVVYNHFGPEGNFLGAYAPAFFTDDWHTPWGQAIDFRRPEVRRFFVENALFWLDCYGFDGLRLDAVHAIADPSRPDILTELAALVRAELAPHRHIHLVLENDANAAHRLARGVTGAVHGYDAQWNDDVHHVAHHLLTGERDGYYADFTTDPVGKLARALSEGFIYQGEPSVFRDDERRGEPSGHLPPVAFVGFIQNHDQVGNRAFGERLTRLADPAKLAAMHAILLLAPAPPLLFMGEEWGATTPFLFFTDFHDALADAVREGRRREFARFPAFVDPKARARIPDPNASTTFERSKLDWNEAASDAGRRARERVRQLLALRRREIVPLIPALSGAAVERHDTRAFTVRWHDGAAPRLQLSVNLGDDTLTLPASGRGLYAAAGVDAAESQMRLPAWTLVWRGLGEPG